MPTIATLATLGTAALSSSSHFPAIVGSELGEAGDVALGVGDVFCKAIGGYITTLGDDDRDSMRRLLQCARRCGPSGLITSGVSDTICIAGAETAFDLQVATVNPAERRKPVPQRGPDDLRFLAFVITIQPADQPYTPVRLRTH